MCSRSRGSPRSTQPTTGGREHSARRLSPRRRRAPRSSNRTEHLLRARGRGLERLGIGAPTSRTSPSRTSTWTTPAGWEGCAQRFPDATVWVHERGARHLADHRLLESVTSIYGVETTATLFGPVEPVAAQRIRALGDGDRIELGGRHLEALATPGHAKHHVALADSSTGPSSPATRSASAHPMRVRSGRHAAPDYDSSSRSPRSSASASAHEARSSCSRTSAR